MKEKIISPLIVFYDGACVVCSHEINHYRKLKGSENIQWIDISSPSFSPANYKADLRDVQKTMHSLRGETLYKGVETFTQIWSELPKYQWLSRLSQKNGVRHALELGYSFFVKIRPYLPRRKCESDYCRTN